MNGGYTISDGRISVQHFVGEECSLALCGDHCHDKYEITYLVSSSGRYIVEGSEHKIIRGSLILISPMCYHNVRIAVNENTEAYTIYFNKNIFTPALASMFDKIIKDEDANGSIFTPSRVSEAIVDCFERFSVCCKLNKEEQEVFINALLSEIIVLLSATVSKRIVASEDDLGARIARYINSNISRDLSLDRVARRFFVSKFYLCRAFKSYSGISVHAYINQKRIAHARVLMESGLTASDAAERVGFGDYSAFYRAYIKITGKSPTAE